MKVEKDNYRFNEYGYLIDQNYEIVIPYKKPAANSINVIKALQALSEGKKVTEVWRDKGSYFQFDENGVLRNHDGAKVFINIACIEDFRDTWEVIDEN